MTVPICSPHQFLILRTGSARLQLPPGPNQIQIQKVTLIAHRHRQIVIVLRHPVLLRVRVHLRIQIQMIRLDQLYVLMSIVSSVPATSDLISTISLSKYF